MHFILHWLAAAGAFVFVSSIVPGTSITPTAAIIAAFVLGLLNLFVRPLLLLLTLPINVLTLGLFSFVINAGLVLLVAYLVPEFSVVSFSDALIFAFVLSVVHWVLHLFKL